MNDGHEIAMSLRAAYLAMHRAAEAHFIRAGVTADQFVLMSLLRDDGVVSQRELVRRASSDPNTIGAMLALLEGRGFVARGRHPSDGRARSVALTRKGKRVFEKLWTRSAAFREKLLAEFRPEEAELLHGFLIRIIREMTPTKDSS
jgi:DNA-binding MarR family transcriptional regulator